MIKSITNGSMGASRETEDTTRNLTINPVPKIQHTAVSQKPSFFGDSRTGRSNRPFLCLFIAQNSLLKYLSEYVTLSMSFRRLNDACRLRPRFHAGPETRFAN